MRARGSCRDSGLGDLTKTYARGAAARIRGLWDQLTTHARAGQLRGRVKPFAALAEVRTSLGQRQGSRGLASSDPASYRRSSLQQARSSACTAALYGTITRSRINNGSKRT